MVVQPSGEVGTEVAASADATSIAGTGNVLWITADRESDDAPEQVTRHDVGTGRCTAGPIRLPGGTEDVAAALASIAAAGGRCGSRSPSTAARLAPSTPLPADQHVDLDLGTSTSDSREDVGPIRAGESQQGNSCVEWQRFCRACGQPLREADQTCVVCGQPLLRPADGRSDGRGMFVSRKRLFGRTEAVVVAYDNDNVRLLGIDGSEQTVPMAKVQSLVVPDQRAPSVHAWEHLKSDPEWNRAGLVTVLDEWQSDVGQARALAEYAITANEYAAASRSRLSDTERWWVLTHMYWRHAERGKAAEAISHLPVGAYPDAEELVAALWDEFASDDQLVQLAVAPRWATRSALGRTSS